MLGLVLVIFEAVILVIAFIGLREVSASNSLQKISKKKRGALIIIIPFLISVLFLYVSVPIPNPDNNFIEYTRTNIPFTFEYTVKDDEGYLHSVLIRCLYYQQYEYNLNCYFEFYREDVLTNTIQVSILSSSPYQQEEVGTSRGPIDPGTYNVTFSYSESVANERTVTFSISQEEVRPTADSDFQFVFRIVAAAFLGFTVFCLGNYDMYPKSGR